MSKQGGIKLSRRELAALRHLDWQCWEDSEAGGDGWCDVAHFSESFAVSTHWARALLRNLVTRGLAEVRGSWRRLYAPSEQGANLIAGDRP
jgi:hypothetical protein